MPQDLEEATVVRLLMNMEGFRIDREALEKRFAGKAGAAPGDGQDGMGAGFRSAGANGRPGSMDGGRQNVAESGRGRGA